MLKFLIIFEFLIDSFLIFLFLRNPLVLLFIILTTRWVLIFYYLSLNLNDNKPVFLLNNKKISDITIKSHGKDLTAKEALMLWVHKHLEGYPGIFVKDFSHSWRDGKAFLAIMHRHK